MQIYLTSQDSEAAFVDLVQQTLAKQQLQNDFKVDVLPVPQRDKQKIIDPMSATAVTVLVTALGAGGAITVGMGKEGAITHIVKALEALINRKVEVKIKHNGKTIELTGSAGHIERMLNDVLEFKQD